MSEYPSISEFDVSNISYDRVQNKNGMKYVMVLNKSTKEYLTFRLPLLMTWGAREGQDNDKKPTGKWTFSLAFNTPEMASQESLDALEGLIRLEKKIRADGFAKSMEWFGKTYASQDITDDKFHPMLQYPKIEGTSLPNYNRPPTFKVKLPCYKGVWQSEIYDENCQPLFLKGKSDPTVTPADFLVERSNVISLVQCAGLYFVGNTVYITWNLKQAIVQKPAARLEGVCLLRPSVLDAERMKASKPPTVPLINRDIDDPSDIAVVYDQEDESYQDESTSAAAPPAITFSAPPTYEEPPVVAPAAAAPEPATPATAASSASADKPKTTTVKKVVKRKSDEISAKA